MGAAAVYFIFQAVMAAPLLKNYTWSLDHQDPGFRQMVRLAVPTLISGSIVQVNTIILTGFADQFPGAATSLRNAATTWQLPYGIFVVAIGNVMLPSLPATMPRWMKPAAASCLARACARPCS
jgi:putative peptidoglycan lipid II flippase